MWRVTAYTDAGSQKMQMADLKSGPEDEIDTVQYALSLAMSHRDVVTIKVERVG